MPLLIPDSRPRRAKHCLSFPTHYTSKRGPACVSNSCDLLHN
jgi:hypothetical protein